MAMTHEEKDKVLANQQAEIEKLKAELAEKEKENAKADSDKDAKIEELKKLLEEKKNPEVPAANTADEPATEETVRLRLYKDERIVNDQEVFVNGHPYLLQRGVEVDVPKSVAGVLHNKQVMQNRIAAYNAKHADKK